MWRIEDPLSERNGRLYLQGHSISQIAGKFGTPIYAYSEERVRNNYERLHKAFAKNYKNFRINYAIKANSNISILKLLKSLGSGADCSSPAEITFAKLAGFNGKEMLYTSNYNSAQDFSYAIKEGATINFDDISQIQKAFKIKRQSRASIRINPGVGRGEFKQIITAGPDAKFGVPHEKAIEAYKMLQKFGVKEFGIHMMTGSNVLDADYFRQITSKLLDIAGKVSKETGIEFSFVDIGGGLGVPYKVGEKELDIEKVGKSVAKMFKEKCSEHSLGEPELMVEPGRYIMADAGILVARVTDIKKSYKTFVGSDAGMNTLIRPSLYGAYHHILVDGKADSNNYEGHRGKCSRFDVCGQVCESADVLAKDRKLPQNVSENDLLIFLNCGAYGFVMSSQYNSRPRPAELLANKKGVKLIRKSEDISYLIGEQHVKKP